MYGDYRISLSTVTACFSPATRKEKRAFVYWKFSPLSLPLNWNHSFIVWSFYRGVYGFVVIIITLSYNFRINLKLNVLFTTFLIKIMDSFERESKVSDTIDGWSGYWLYKWWLKWNEKQCHPWICLRWHHIIVVFGKKSRKFYYFIPERKRRFKSYKRRTAHTWDR